MVVLMRNVNVQGTRVTGLLIFFLLLIVKLRTVPFHRHEKVERDGFRIEDLQTKYSTKCLSEFNDG